MILKDYLDPRKFPLTTQANISPSAQLFRDAANWDAMKEQVINSGVAMNERQKAIWAELKEKMQHNRRLVRELAESGPGIDQKAGSGARAK